jgi:hypothetical protein
MVFGARPEHLQALFFRPPFQNSDVHMTDTPPFHGKAVCLVKIDGVGSNQSRSIIVDNVLLVGIGDSETCPEWKARPIGRRAFYMVGGKPLPNGITRPAFLSVRIGGRPHALHAPKVWVGLRRAANDQGRGNSCQCKVKALAHLAISRPNSKRTGFRQAKNFAGPPNVDPGGSQG